MGVVAINFVELGSLLFEVTKIRGRNMFRKMYQGGSSRKQRLRIAMRDADDEPPRNAPEHPYEWPSENFMD